MRRALWLVAVCTTLVQPVSAGAWGLDAHRWIAVRAADLVGKRCAPLVDGHAEELGARALEPDTVLKPRLGRAETIRHFLDLDDYGAPPFRALPRDYERAVARFGRQTVDQRGILPWHGAALALRLREEIGRRDWTRARVTAGHLAHYAADATMPLHATRNHDGQLTHQRGLHARVERRLVDDHITRYAERARRVRRRSAIAPAEVRAALFTALEDAYGSVAPLLAADRAARAGTRVGSRLYYRRLEVDVGERLARQLGAGAALTAALWEGACAAAPLR